MKNNVSTEKFGCWQRVNWPWPVKSLREWACKLWTPSGKKWTILETTKNRHSWPQLFLQRTNKNLWQQKVDVTSSSKQEQTKTKSAIKKSWPHLFQGRLKLPNMLVLCLLLTLLLVQHLQVKIWITKWLSTGRLYLNLNFSLLHLLPQAVPLCFHALWNFKWCSFTL